MHNVLAAGLRKLHRFTLLVNIKGASICMLIAFLLHYVTPLEKSYEAP